MAFFLYLIHLVNILIYTVILPIYCSTFKKTNSILQNVLSYFHYSGCTTPGRADLAFALDSSGSIGRANWFKVLDFVKAMALSLRIDSGVHKLGVVSFGSLGTREFNLEQYQRLSEMLPAIDR